MDSATQLSLAQARRFMAGSPWMEMFPEDLRESFLASTRLLPSFDRGQRVYNIGDAPDGIYGVVSGCFGFEIAPQEEGPQLIHQYRPGSWFGELAHVLEQPRLAAMYATRPSQCLLMQDLELARLLRSDPRLWRCLALSLAGASQLALTTINDLMMRSPKRRLAAALLRIAGLRNDDSLQATSLQLHLTHATLAAMTNISRSTVAQYLRELEEEGYLKYRYGKIILVDPLSIREWLRVSSG